MTPLCPVCDKPMKEHGRAFRCEPCQQIMIFFSVSDASPYLAGKPLEPEAETTGLAKRSPRSIDRLNLLKKAADHPVRPVASGLQ
jgi:hypothetical protein